MWILGPKGRQVRVGMGTIPAFALTVVRTSQPRRSKLSKLKDNFGREKQFEIHKIHKNQFKF